MDGEGDPCEDGAMLLLAWMTTAAARDDTRGWPEPGAAELLVVVVDAGGRACWKEAAARAGNAGVARGSRDGIGAACGCGGGHGSERKRCCEGIGLGLGGMDGHDANGPAWLLGSLPFIC